MTTIDDAARAPPSAGSAPWPIVSGYDVRLAPRDLDCAHALAGRVSAEEPALDAGWFREEGVSSGWANGPGVYFEDHREIQLASEAVALAYEYRALGLAGSDDFYLLTGARCLDFEAYQRDVAGLGTPRILGIQARADDASRPIAERCLADARAFEVLVRAARASAGLNLLPYLATGRVWMLARALARASGQPIRVAGPGPRLALRANDKLWFAARVRELLGSRALPPTLSVYGLSAAAARLKQLAGATERLVVKLTASAGGAGNLTFAAAELEGLTLRAIVDHLRSSLDLLGWVRRFPLLVGIWEGPVHESPSAQMWIPAAQHGSPIIEGIFLQSLSGPTKGFVGATPAELSAPIRDRFVDEAMRIAAFFQALGYFGRLSLDAILLGEQPEHAEIHWIECNGRWGGVSLPLTIANRFRPGRPPGGLAIVQRSFAAGRSLPFRRLLDRLDARLLRRSEVGRAAIFLRPTESGYLDFVALSHDRADALALAAGIADLVLPTDAPPEPPSAWSSSNPPAGSA